RGQSSIASLHFRRLADNWQLGNGPSAVEADDLAGNVGAGGAEEVDEFGDVLGGAGAGEGDALEVLLAFFGGVVIGPIDDAGGDAIDGDFGGELAGEAEGEVPEAGLGGAVAEEFGPWAFGQQVDHVD